MIHIYTTLSLISFFVCLHLSAYVFFRNSRSRQNIVFSLFCLTLAIVCFAEFMFRQAETAQRALFWLNFQQLWPISLALLLHFVLIYTKALGRVVRRILVPVYLSALGIHVLDRFFFSVEPQLATWGWTYSVSNIWVYETLSTYASVMGILCLILLIRYQNQNQDPHVRVQNKFILLAMSIPILVGFVCDWLLPILSINTPELTFSSFALMASIIGYAVRKHDLFSVSTALAADTIIDTMSEGLLVINARLQIEIFNPALKRILHKSSTDLKGRHLSVIFGELDTINDINELDLRGLPSGTVILPRGKRESFPASISNSLLKDMASKTRGAVFIIRDVSEQEAAREALVKAREELELRVEQRTAELKDLNKLLIKEIGEKTEAEKQVRAERETLLVTLKSIRDGVIATDKTGQILLLNDTACKVLGFSRENALGRHLSDIYKVFETVNGQETVHDPIADCTTEQAASPLRNFYMRSAEGTQRIIAETSAPILDSQGSFSGTVVVFRDITHHRKIEDEHFKARKLESMSTMASGIAEEFSSLLSSIVTNIFMARMSLDANSESNKLLTVAETAAFRANSMINQLLTFSRNNSSIREKTSVSEFITNSVGFYMQDLQSDYQLCISEGLWEVEIDKGQIDQVLNNVIQNADQAMPSGGTIIIEATNFDSQDNLALNLSQGKYVRIAIIDKGEGISEENLHRIFDPYYTTRINRIGLGLTTAYAIIDQHEGTISVESRPGEGSTFSIFLPAVSDEEDELEEAQQSISDTQDE